jgi:hypothetical protein
MVTFLPAPQPLEGFKKGIGELSDTIQKKLLSKKQGAALEKLGINIAGIDDPKLKATIAKEQLKEKANKELLGELGLNDTAKSKLLGDGQGAGGAEGEENITPEMLKQGLPLYQRLNEDQKIKLAVRHPQLANLLQKQADSARRSDLEERKFNQGEEHFGKTFGLAEKKEERQGKQFDLSHDLNEKKSQIQQQQFLLSKELEKLRAQQQELQFEKSHGLAEKKANTQEHQFEKTHQYKKEETKQKEETADIKKSKEYLEEVRQKYQRSQALSPVFGQLKEAIKAGGGDTLSFGNLADIGSHMGGFVGETLRQIGKAGESGETGKIRSLSKRLLDEMKDIFGGQVRVSEFQAFLGMLPEIGKSQESNLAIVDVLENLAKASSRFYETAQEIIQENDGEIPANLPDLVQKKISPEIKSFAEDMQNSIDKGKSALKNQDSKNLTKDKALEFLKSAKGDKAQARELARKQGYKF